MHCLMHYADIIAGLHKAGTSGALIADELGVTPQAVSRVIHGRISSRRIAECISAAIGKPPTVIWPDGRYAKRIVQPAVRRAATDSVAAEAA